MPNHTRPRPKLAPRPRTCRSAPTTPWALLAVTTLLLGACSETPNAVSDDASPSPATYADAVASGDDAGVLPAPDVTAASAADSTTPPAVDAAPPPANDDASPPPASDAAPPPPNTTASYLFEDFENDDWRSKYTFVAGNVFREAGKAARSGQYGVRIHVPVGEHWGGALNYNHGKHGQGGNFKEIWARYYVRFGANWGRDADIYIGKAGYRARSDEVCSAPCLEMTDSHEMAGSDELIGASYYHRRVSDDDYANRTFDHHKYRWEDSGLRERERWYCIESHHVLNTPGQANGVYQNWVDGVLVSDHHSVEQRASATFDIDSSTLIAYVGGGWVSDREMDIYFDDWAVSDQRIGCQ